MLGLGTGAALVAAAAAGVALTLACAAAPAWGGGGDQGRGRMAGWVGAGALAIAGGLPLGFGTTALLLAADAASAPGPPRSWLGVVVGLPGIVAAGAAALAARGVLARSESDQGRGRVRLDALAAVAASLVMALLPGLVLSGVVVRVAGRDGGVVALDSAAIAGPGGGWAGGYAVLAVLVCAAAVASGAALSGIPGPRHERLRLAVRGRAVAPLAERVATAGQAVLRRVDSGLGALDRWLVGQPGLLLIAAAAVAVRFLVR
jgi:hypothetical protein